MDAFSFGAYQIEPPTHLETNHNAAPHDVIIPSLSVYVCVCVYVCVRGKNQNGNGREEIHSEVIWTTSEMKMKTSQTGELSRWIEYFL